ncbi:hypothetical protein BD289DRAFT_186500 [Coniella lustricola]|uniref:Uncharacterized protein n=1 Tax=Coniella lustricola TaxID=2025994 RepID=A0A2T3AD21_9PEZI|nr:hypothetical protein BD289DRAFT_186500 [Coniella lustricola]
MAERTRSCRCMAACNRRRPPCLMCGRCWRFSAFPCLLICATVPSRPHPHPHATAGTKAHSIAVL